MADTEALIAGSFCPIPAIRGGIGRLLLSGYKYRISEDSGDLEKLCAFCCEFFPADTEFYSTERRFPYRLHKYCRACVYETTKKKTKTLQSVIGSDNVYCPLPTIQGGIQRLLLSVSKYRIGELTGNLEKLCNKCRMYLPFDTGHFSAHKGNSSGLHKLCESCVAIDCVKNIDKTRLTKSTLHISYFLLPYRNYRSLEAELESISDLAERARLFGIAGFSLNKMADTEKLGCARLKRNLMDRQYIHPSSTELIENKILFAYSKSLRELLILLTENGYSRKAIVGALDIDGRTLRQYAEKHGILL